MSTHLRRFSTSLHLLDAVVARVPSVDWDNPSACAGWSAREVAGHAAWLTKNIGSIAVGAGSIAGQAEALVLGDDPAANMREIIATTLFQLDQPDSLERMLPTPWGELTVDDFIGEVWIDPIVHAWDVADAAGIEHGIDEGTALVALAQIDAMSDAHVEAWEFGAPQPSVGSSAVAQLVARTGRRPVSGGVAEA